MVNTKNRSRIPPSMQLPDGPVRENLFHRMASVALDVIVIGAGFEGLAAAYNLKQAGHNVRVFEKSDGRARKLKGCSRAPPNMVKMLQQWGLEPRLDCGIVSSRVDFRHGSSGELASKIVYHKEFMKELGAEMYGLHYDDLCDMTRELLTLAGVKVECRTEVVDVDAEDGTVQLANGRRITADLIVGADGPHSIARQAIVGYKEEIEIGPFCTYSFVVSIKKMQKDASLAALCDSQWTLWLGDPYCILGYQMRDDDYIVMVNGPQLQGIVQGKLIPLSKVDISQFEDRIRRLFALATTSFTEELHYNQQPLEEWCSDSGKVVLVGDSVHVGCPSSSNSHALAMEDSATLGCLLSRLGSRDEGEMLQLLSAYQEIREERCARTMQSDSELVLFCSLPPCPERDQRDEGFRAALSKADLLDWENAGDDMLRDAFEEFRFSFAYDAYDAADEWWNDWGLTRQRMNAAQSLGGMMTGCVVSTFTSDGDEALSDEIAVTA